MNVESLLKSIKSCIEYDFDNLPQPQSLSNTIEVERAIENTVDSIYITVKLNE